MQEPASLFLAYVAFPLWVAAGFADWICHLRTGIAQTSGLKENLLHLLMFAEISVGIAAVVLLEINAAVLMLVLVLERNGLGRDEVLRPAHPLIRPPIVRRST